LSKFWNIKASLDNQSTELFVYGDISDSAYWDEVGAKEFVADLSKVTSNDITVRINSGGGSVFAGFAMYNSLKQHKANITVRVDGLAGSAASIVAMAGDKIIMPLGSMMFIHNSWTYAAGNASELSDYADMLKKIDASMLEVYKAKTGLDEKAIKDLMDKDSWLTAFEAKELGFATDVEDIQIAASLEGKNLVFGSVKHNYDKLPKNGLKIDIGASIEANTNQKKEIEMTFDEVKAKFSNDIKALTDEAYLNGVKAENQRLKEIDDLEVSGHKDLVVTAKYGETTVNAGILAMNVLKAEREAKANLMKDIKADADEIKPTVDNSKEGQEPEDKKEAEQVEAKALFAKVSAKIKR
jgi:ATP-dependent protease ClpP protease subunit